VLLVFFSLRAGAGIMPLPFYLKAVLAVALLAAYALYIRQIIKSGGGKQEDTPEKLTMWRSSSEASTLAVAAQVGDGSGNGSGGSLLRGPHRAPLRVRGGCRQAS
jgi:hypothetical protein